MTNVDLLTPAWECAIRRLTEAKEQGLIEDWALKSGSAPSTIRTCTIQHRHHGGFSVESVTSATDAMYVLWRVGYGR